LHVHLAYQEHFNGSELQSCRMRQKGRHDGPFPRVSYICVTPKLSATRSQSSMPSSVVVAARL
jgi:hypothetical protein